MKYAIRTIFVLVILAFPWSAKAQAATQHSIQISWSYTQGADLATGFNVYRATISGGPYTRQNPTLLPLTTLTYTDTTGVGGTQYFYVTTAVDAGGFESAFSNQASAVFLQNPSPPGGEKAVAQ